MLPLILCGVDDWSPLNEEPVACDVARHANEALAPVWKPHQLLLPRDRARWTRHLELTRCGPTPSHPSGLAHAHGPRRSGVACGCCCHAGQARGPTAGHGSNGWLPGAQWHTGSIADPVRRPSGRGSSCGGTHDRCCCLALRLAVRLVSQSSPPTLRNVHPPAAAEKKVVY